ncbi:MAG: hypothetical protein AAGA48_03920 [Myxococcota bacterium]
MSPWLALARADRVNVLRDPMLLGASLAPLPLGGLVRFGGPWLHEAAPAVVDPTVLEAIVGSALLVLPALLAGTVQGYLLLEERDEHVEAAIRMTPLGTVGLWRWRLSTSFAMGLIGGGVAWGIAGLAIPATWGLGLLVGASHAPLIALILATYARDKVQGLALSKVTSLAAVAQVALLFPEPWAWLGAPFPAWWLARGLRPDAGAMVVAATIVGAFAFHGAYFSRSTARS